MLRSNDFQIFIKPVGAGCNLSCSYCYYLSKAELFSPAMSVVMNEEVLENYIRQHIAYSDSDIISFSWHGGEPLMAGLDFFSRAVEFQKAYSPSGKRIVNGIQTNGTLIDKEWALFFKRNNFTVGISIDGPAYLHDMARKNSSGAGSHQKSLRGWKILQGNGVAVQALCVVSANNEREPLLVYNYLKNIGARYISFIPLVMGASGDGPGELSVNAGRFGDFLIEVFEQWKKEDVGEVHIQIFDEALRMAGGLDHSQCIFRKDCGGVPVLEHNGSLYSCDHYVSEQYLLGNISVNSLSGMIDSSKQESFGRSKSSTLPDYCVKCEVLDMCNGECPRYRIINTPDGEPGLNYLCEGYRKFFSHITPFVKLVAEMQKGR